MSLEQGVLLALQTEHSVRQSGEAQQSAVVAHASDAVFVSAELDCPDIRYVSLSEGPLDGRLTAYEHRQQRKPKGPRFHRAISSLLGEEHSVIYMEVETSSGPRTIYVRGYRNKIRALPGNRALIEDVEGNRYEVRNLDSFPKLTRDILGL